jgi:GNAT superfamily N-acetyltransferase
MAAAEICRRDSMRNCRTIGDLMAFHWTQSTDTIDWEEMSELYRIAPLGNKSGDWLKTTYSNSMFKCIAFDGGKIVAAGRAVADGADCSYLCDIVVHPAYQGTGLGKELIQRLVNLSKGHRKIILYAVPGREPFYEKFGFRRMNTAMAIFEDPQKAAADGYI